MDAVGREPGMEMLFNNRGEKGLGPEGEGKV